jgi:rfaE bifunctional protein kinase chain/domain
MNSERMAAITARYAGLRVVLVGDFCLDRYLEIDPARAEVSIETGRTVHNVMRVRSQPGAAGTILNNLVALGVGEVRVVGFCGEDGEGYELQRALERLPGVTMGGWVVTPERRTFTYCKPLVCRPGEVPVELDRLDSKNWGPTPAGIETLMIEKVVRQSADADAVIAMDQVDVADTGVITHRVREALGQLAKGRPRGVFLGDSRRGLGEWPPMSYKMNGAELASWFGLSEVPDLKGVRERVESLAGNTGWPVYVTLAERGMVGATPEGGAVHVPAYPVSGPIDVVGAGDAVTANLAVARAAGATLEEAMTLAMAAAHTVVHQLGTTGTADVEALRKKVIS